MRGRVDPASSGAEAVGRAGRIGDPVRSRSTSVSDAAARVSPVDVAANFSRFSRRWIITGHLWSWW